MYVCPVCGFPDLEEPPAMFSICSCCGTEFELDDAFLTHGQLRERWLRAGALWWSPRDKPPDGWDPYAQVDNVIASIPI